MVKITVMVPVELEVNVTGHGELRILASRTPIERQDILKKCNELLEVIPECLADDYCQTNENGPLAYYGNYAIIQRKVNRLKVGDRVKRLGFLEVTGTIEALETELGPDYASIRFDGNTAAFCAQVRKENLIKVG